jgi:hypothetical protein
MGAIGNNISSDLAAQIQLLSSIKDDSNLEPADKEAKLKQEGAKTLAMIAKEKDSLSIVNLAFAANIQDVIRSALATDDWDGIPPPTEIKREIADLQQVSQALAQSLSQGFNDANEVLKLLIDINAKYGQAKAKEWLLHIKNSMESANEQFKETSKSIASQKQADRTSAIGQIVGGSLSCAMSAGSMIGSAINAKKQLSAFKDQREIHVLKDTMDTAGTKSEEMRNSVVKEKAEFEKMKSNNSFTDAEVDAQDIRLASHESLTIEADKNFKIAQEKYRDIKYQADKINIKNQTEAAQINMLGGLGGGMNSIANGAAALHSADQKADASYSKLEADKKELQKSFDQNMAQTCLDNFQKTGQLLDKHIQAMLNMEQSRAGQISAATRA